MKQRMQKKLIWFSVLGWVLFLIMCFFKSSDMGLNNSPLPIRSVSTIVTPFSQRPYYNTQEPGQFPDVKGASKDDAVEQEKLLNRANSTTTTQTASDTLPDDWLEYYSSGREVVHALWEGNVSSKMLSPRLQRAKKQYVDQNDYNVTYRPLQKKWLEKQDLLCQLKQHAQIRTLDGTEKTFTSWKQLLPSQPLEKLNPIPFRTCAVVSSAGSILGSSLGNEIDSHDAVLRFNAAPTEDYDIDVGNKTTIRIINSQILANPEHRFNTSSLYKNVTLVVWDPTAYSADLQKWHETPEFDLFTEYTKHRKCSPSQPFYILHPAFIWSLWTMLQNNTDENIQPNPPSSGYIGIALMMNLCKRIDVYEFIPSKRHTTLCHYYEQNRDMACTLGAYHPLLFEKLLVRRMAFRTSLAALSEKGKVTLHGFSQIKCPP